MMLLPAGFEATKPYEKKQIVSLAWLAWFDSLALVCEVEFI